MKSLNAKRLIFVSILVLGWMIHFPSLGQLPDHQYVEIVQSPEWEIYPGQRRNLEVDIKILEGYYVQADQVENPTRIPTSVTTVEAPINIVVYNPIYPQPKSIKLMDAQDSIKVFQDCLRLFIPVEVKNEAKIGQHKITMNLEYQACDSIKCFSPRSLSFMINVVVNERTPYQENE